MPWTKNDYPSSMKNLDQKVKNKAIEIANELLDEGYSEDRAIPIAIDRAKEWANHDSSDTTNNTHNSSSNSSNTNSSDSYFNNQDDQHVLPDGNKWSIKKEKSEKASYTFDTKDEAIDKAKEIANNQSVNVIIHRKDGTIEDTINPQ